MEQKYGEFVGVDNLYYALITTDTSSEYIAGTPVYLAPVAEIAGSPEIDNTTTYYDNKAANNFVTEGKTELTITVANIPANVMATLLGKSYDEATGRVYDSGEATPPAVAVGFRYNMGANGYRYYWYLNGTFSGGTEDAQSKADKIEVKTYDLTYEAVTTSHEWTIDGESTSLKRVFADTANNAFNAEGWFDQVQTPSTSSAPPAIALSSIVPADDATSVAVSSTVVLTFNNKIAEDNVTLISNAGVIVAATKSYDTTGKILTITPSTSLSAATSYIVSVAGVVDVYGQKLTAMATNFTTAS